MNDQLSYESIIAARLEQLPPLPAMADAIWSRISDELDKEMPNDRGVDNNNGPGSGPGSIGNAWWTGMGAIVLLVATVFYMAKRKVPAIRAGAPNKTDSALMATPSPAVSEPSGNNRADTTAVYRPLPPITVPQATADHSLPVDSVNQSEADSMPVVESKTIIAPLLADDKHLPKDESTVPFVSSPDTAVIKKSKGVSGLSQKEYRIVPGKKDSTRKSN